MTRDGEVEGQPRPRQKVMITAGRRSRDVPSRQGWPSQMAAHEEMAAPSQPSRIREMDEMAGRKAMGIRMCWISLLHSLWSTPIVHLLQRLILVILFQ